VSNTIFSNASSLRAQRSLAKAQEGLTNTFEKLSSGMRINKVSDDAASLSIAMSLQKDIRISTAAIRNTNDGVSMITIADGGLSEVTNVLSRMAELAEQSANGTYSNTQRSALSNEFIALASEIERVSTTTKFNGINLLSGISQIGLQVGLNGTSSSVILVSQVQGTLSSMSLAGTGSSSLTYSLISDSVSNSQAAARTALQAVTNAIEYVASQRGNLGAAASRLSSALNNLSSSRESYSSALSRIQDIDVAEESANLIKNQILNQASISILAQANQQPGLVLKLLN
jgi:flagellin